MQTFLRQSLLLLLVFGLLNASNYAFHVVVSRLLGPSEYGALAALLAVILVLSVPFAVLQTALANQTAALRAHRREHEVAGFAADALKTVLPFAWAAGLVVLVVGTPLLSVFLHIGLVPAMLLAPYVVASVPLSVAYGVLQGQLRFKALAVLILVGVALRFALGVTLVSAGLGVSGALLGTVARNRADGPPGRVRDPRRPCCVEGREADRPSPPRRRGNGALRLDELLGTGRGGRRPRSALP